MIKCLVCGNLTREDRAFCQFCGSRLPQEAAEPVPQPQELPEPQAEESLQELRDQLAAARAALAHSMERLTATEGETDRLRRQLRTVDDVLTHGDPEKEVVIAELTRELEAANQQVQYLSAKLAANQMREMSTGNEPWFDRPRMLVVCGLVLTLVGAVLGFIIGARSTNVAQVQMRLDAELQKEQALEKQQADQARQLGELRRQLDAAQQSAASITTGTGAVERQLRQQVQTLTADLNRTTSRLNELWQMVQRHPAWNYRGPSTGYLQWEGDVRGVNQPVLVILDHGRLDVKGAPGRYQVIGKLPGVACALQPTGNNVLIASAPSAADGWQRVAFRVEGSGHVLARVNWSVL
jgi:hypothetical protein